MWKRQLIAMGYAALLPTVSAVVTVTVAAAIGALTQHHPHR
ncbi:hypothetical protein [Actinoplanes sp. TBRC 11911]|nr:hypothetical protein [Actinoplanes sp. TBRC 11911]